jgi:TatD DNase family protein
MGYIDAHNHLQDERLDPLRDAAISECERIGLRHAVVNGTHPSDWGRVADLAERYPWVLPSFGVHPWYIDKIPSDYLAVLGRYLDERPSALGEIGIDHWKEGHDRQRQEDVFLAQLAIARDRNLPVTIHGLKAWGRLLELLRAHGVPSRGFLLHSYSGPVELVQPFSELGAYFSVSPAFFVPQRAKKLDIFRSIQLDRLLPETDAPDQVPSEEINLYRAPLGDARAVNHPGNIRLVYEGLAFLCGVPQTELNRRFKQNFLKLFGGCLP